MTKQTTPHISFSNLREEGAAPLGTGRLKLQQNTTITLDKEYYTILIILVLVYFVKTSTNNCLLSN